MGTAGHDIAVFPVDEQALLDRVNHEHDRIQVLGVPKALGSTWLYQAEQFRMGTTIFAVEPDAVRRYRRTLDADEIQYQISGRRTLLTQRGIVELVPGDFVRVPLGIAHASVGHEPGAYISVFSHRELPQVADTARTAQPYSPEYLASLTGERSSR
ncbi:hypothetical protein ACFYO7_30235 [Nocardia salmonicida]|uniref:hypothetical protein n=1 Tax=Nocardia salmonicida TaxID=53431 RepID=UPI0036B28188